jgi:hypothetical protein
MLVKHMPTLFVINEYMSAKPGLKNLFCREEGAPAGYHVLAVAVVLDVADDAFREYILDLAILLGGSLFA